MLPELAIPKVRRMPLKIRKNDCFRALQEIVVTHEEVLWGSPVGNEPTTSRKKLPAGTILTCLTNSSPEDENVPCQYLMPPRVFLRFFRYTDEVVYFCAVSVKTLEQNCERISRTPTSE
jgi:hypothetical protein